VSVDAQVLDESLRWEAAPNGDPFPHVYAPRPRARIRLPQPGLPVTRVGHHPSGVPHRDGRLTQDHRTPAAASCHAAKRASVPSRLDRTTLPMSGCGRTLDRDTLWS
jgi:hypothetical protein